MKPTPQPEFIGTERPSRPVLTIVQPLAEPPAETPEAEAEASGWRRFLRPAGKRDATVAELVDSYLEDLIKRDSPSVYDVRSVARKHFDAELRGMHAADVARNHVEAWMRWKESEGLAHETRLKMLTILSCVFRFGIETGAVDDNPCAGVSRGRRETRKNVDREILTRLEISAITTDQRIPFERRLLWAVLLFTGARIGEAQGLCWGDWDPDRRPLGEIRIVRQFSHRKRRLADTKTRCARSVAVHPVLARMLGEARLRFEQAHGHPPGPDVPICDPRTSTRPHAARWSQRGALKAWKKDLELIGSRPRVVHSTRHTFISALLNAKASPIAVRSMTHSTKGGDAFSKYTHTSHAAKCAAVLALELDQEGGAR